MMSDSILSRHLSKDSNMYIYLHPHFWQRLLNSSNNGYKKPGTEATNERMPLCGRNLCLIPCLYVMKLPECVPDQLNAYGFNWEGLVRRGICIALCKGMGQYCAPPRGLVARVTLLVARFQTGVHNEATNLSHADNVCWSLFES